MSFAKDNWEEFEKLSLSILETYLPTDSEFSYSITHTPHRKDGGYDGLIIISSSDENIDQYKILSESKLRELSNKDLPMSDFSKTLIIAINLMAQEIYIFTNLHYSTETQKRIRKFSSFSNIRVELVDIMNFSEQDINDITDYLSEEELSIRARASLLNILKPESVSNEIQQDIMQFYFFEYLYRIYVPILRRQRQVIYFHNLDYASSSALQILNKFIKKFEKENILLILEIRTDIKKCDEFLEYLLKDVPVLYITEIKEFNSMELNQYFEHKYKNVFSFEEEKNLKRILPRTPLLIDTVTELFRHDLGINKSIL